jgi:hypothetical protein
VAPQFEEGELRRECHVFCRFLIGREPSRYVADKYVSGHASLPAAGVDVLDRALLACAGGAPWMTGVADSYAAVARRDALLRKKLVLLLAILENSPDTHLACDTAIASGRAAALSRIALSGIAFAGRLALSMLLFGFLHLATRVLSGGGRG